MNAPMWLLTAGYVIAGLFILAAAVVVFVGLGVGVYDFFVFRRSTSAGKHRERESSDG